MACRRSPAACAAFVRREARCSDGDVAAPTTRLVSWCDPTTRRDERILVQRRRRAGGVDKRLMVNINRLTALTSSLMHTRYTKYDELMTSLFVLVSKLSGD